MLHTLLLSLLLCTLTTIKCGRVQILRKVRDLLGPVEMRLFIRNSMLDATAIIKLSPDAIVADIYSTMYPPLNQCKWYLMYEGERLQMNSPLASIGLGPESTVEVMQIYSYSYTQQIISTFSETNLKNIMVGRNFLDCYKWSKVKIGQDIPTELDISANYFWHLHGSNIDFGCLSQTLKSITIADTDISSEVDFSQLPMDLETLDLHGNSFSGILDFSKLPRSLVYLNIAKNDFYGSLDISHLPPNLKTLSLEQNSFTGDIIIGELPLHLWFIDLNGNPFNGKVDLQGIKNTKVKLKISFKLASKEFEENFYKAMEKHDIEKQCDYSV